MTTDSADYCMLINEWALRLCLIIEYRSMGIKAVHFFTSDYF